MRLVGLDKDLFPVCMGCGDFQARPGDSEESLYDTYRSAGGNFFDTAHCYAFWVGKIGVSERLLGQLIKRDRRDELIIATKGGHRGYAKYPRPDDFLTPALKGEDLAESLDRLQVDYVDLYYLHRDDERVPVSEIMDALAGLVKTGRVKALAASNWTTARIAAANAYATSKGLPTFVASQPRWSLARSTDDSDPTLHEFDDTDVAWHTKTQMPVIPYTPNAKGYFAEPFHDLPAYDSAENRARRERVKRLADELNVTPDQVALAWLMNLRFPVIPIAGTLNVERLRRSIQAVQIKLTAEQVRDLAVTSAR